jgi:hypothetical protein
MTKSDIKHIFQTIKILKLMKIFEDINLLEQLDQLIRLKATGTPLSLGERLGLSKRQIYRYIAGMKEAMGLKIGYSKKRGSYYYKQETFLKFKVYAIENGQERKIIGGENIWHPSRCSLQFFEKE